MKNVSSLVVILFVVLSNVSVAETCNRDQAFNKMMALGKVVSQMRTSENPASVRESVTIQMEVAFVGKVLAEEDYNEACSQYNKIAVKYEIDLAKEGKTSLTMEELRKDGGKRGGSCSLADAAKKNMELVNDVNDKRALGDMPPEEASAISAKQGKLSSLFHTNPGKVCEELLKIRKEHNL